LSFSKSNPKSDNERLITYINKAFKEVTRNTDNIRDGFKKMLTKYILDYTDRFRNA